MNEHDEPEVAEPGSGEPPAADPSKKRPIGLHKGQIWMSDDFDEPLPWEIFPGFPPEPAEGE